MGVLRLTAEGIIVSVRLTPKASANAVQGLAPNATGGEALKIQVTAVPEGGKANQALIKLLSKEWKIAKSRLEIVSGAAERNKSVLVRGAPKDLQNRLERWLKDIP